MGSTAKVAFLGYDDAQTSLTEEIRRRGFDVESRGDPVTDLGPYDRVVSFGYRHILKPAALRTLKAPIVNLHISYLPYNRGAHPNFWSWMEGTPSGVSIHEIDAGIDTGPIVDQKKVLMEPEGLTFRDTYRLLFKEMEALFVASADEILGGTYQTTQQSENGTFHRASDLPPWMTSWDMRITDAIARFRDGE
ncbi:MAG: formyltransferase family protein [Pseudomonadota bacterium]